MGEEFSETRRVERLREMQAGAPPGVDIEALAAGVLAGPASPDRPPVPVWEYLEYQAAHPDLSIDELSKTRFPIALHCGETTVTSFAELMAPGPQAPTYDLTFEDFVRLYQLKHEAGALRWNPETRTHEEVQPTGSYAASVYGRWRSELQAKADR